jgi:hypothetical protein
LICFAKTPTPCFTLGALKGLYTFTLSSPQVGDDDFKIKPHKSSSWILFAHFIEISSSSAVTSMGFFVSQDLNQSQFYNL